MADEIIAAIAETVPEYDRPMRGEFGHNTRTGVEQALGQFVDLLGAREAAPRGDVIQELGRGEHREGRSLDALQAAYRVGARVAWRRMSQVAEAAGASTSQQRLLAEAIFAYIDQLAAESVAGYAAAQAEQAGDAQRRRRRVVQLLVADPPAATRELEAAAADAAWQLPATLAVVALAPTAPAAGADSVNGPERLAGRIGPDALGAQLDEAALIVVPDADAPRARQRIDAALGAFRAGVGTSVAPEEAALSLRTALRGLELARTAPIFAEDHLAHLLLSADRHIADRLAHRALAPLAHDTPKTRARLESTLREWLATNGHHPTVAARLHVHPQTVRYRLACLRERFGDALDDPQQRFDLQIALRVRDY